VISLRCSAVRRLGRWRRKQTLRPQAGNLPGSPGRVNWLNVAASAQGSSWHEGAVSASYLTSPQFEVERLCADKAKQCRRDAHWPDSDAGSEQCSLLAHCRRPQLRQGLVRNWTLWMSPKVFLGGGQREHAPNLLRLRPNDLARGASHVTARWHRF
jgi:hypothetical protein